MSFLDYLKRAKKLIKHSYKIQAKEEQLTKASIITNARMKKVEQLVLKKRQKLEDERTTLRKMEESNSKLNRCIATGAAEVAELKQEMVKLKALADNETSSLKSHKALLQQMDKYYCLKLLTGVLLKSQQSSPNCIAGVIQCKREDGATKWLPFNIDLSKQSLSSVQYSIWKMLTTGDDHHTMDCCDYDAIIECK